MPISSVRGSSQARAGVALGSASSTGASTGRNRGSGGRTPAMISDRDADEVRRRAARSTSTARAPTPAPMTVPKLKAAWKRGMIVRPSRRSTSAPSTFIATSQTPVPMP